LCQTDPKVISPMRIIILNWSCLQRGSTFLSTGVDLESTVLFSR